MVQESSPTRPFSVRPTVLIADDDPIFRSIAGVILQKDGCQILSASDGQEALIISRTYDGPIDLLLSDVEMPILNGFALRERILVERPGIQVLMMSATTEACDEPLVRKPFDTAQLLKAVRTALGSKQSPPSGTTALVLEDDSSCRFVIRSILERGGFTVHEAAHSGAAIDICVRHPQPISLMVADVVLREPNVPEAAERIRALRPDMAILFTSGSPLEELQRLGLIDCQAATTGRASFLQKPFTANQLLSSTRRLLAD